MPTQADRIRSTLDDTSFQSARTLIAPHSLSAFHPVTTCFCHVEAKDETAERSCSKHCRDARAIVVDRAVAIASSRHARFQRPECPGSARSASIPRASRSECSHYQNYYDQMEATNTRSKTSSTAYSRGTAPRNSDCRYRF